ncbi:MAG: tetratricopeptide repeat protein [Desulfuromonadaceae bacterium]
MWFCRKKIDEQQWEEMNREVMQLIKENRNDEALELGLKLLQLGKDSFGKYHDNTVTALNNLGIVHTMRKDFSDAESYLLSALQIGEKVNGQISSQVALINMNLARLYTHKANQINQKLGNKPN